MWSIMCFHLWENMSFFILTVWNADTKVATTDTWSVLCVFNCSATALNIVHIYRPVTRRYPYLVHKCFYQRPCSHSVSQTCAGLVFIAVWFSYMPCKSNWLCGWCICVCGALVAGEWWCCLNTANQICDIMNKLNISRIVKLVWGNIVL